MDSNKKQANKGIHSGHRNRLYEKFEKNEFLPGDLKQHEILEMFLFLSVHRENTNDTAHRLLNTFGSVESVFEASEDELREVHGVGKKTADLFSDIEGVFDLMRELLSDENDT